jgi:hypothetical protein
MNQLFGLQHRNRVPLCTLEQVPVAVVKGNSLQEYDESHYHRHRQ